MNVMHNSYFVSHALSHLLYIVIYCKILLSNVLFFLFYSFCYDFYNLCKNTSCKLRFFRYPITLLVFSTSTSLLFHDKRLFSFTDLDYVSCFY